MPHQRHPVHGRVERRHQCRIGRRGPGRNGIVAREQDTFTREAVKVRGCLTRISKAVDAIRAQLVERNNNDVDGFGVLRAQHGRRGAHRPEQTSKANRWKIASILQNAPFTTNPTRPRAPAAFNAAPAARPSAADSRHFHDARTMPPHSAAASISRRHNSRYSPSVFWMASALDFCGGEESFTSCSCCKSQKTLAVASTWPAAFPGGFAVIC